MNILLINSTFPPDRGVSTYRVSKFTKYLSRSGCEVYILTRNNKGKKSNELVEDVQDAKEVRRISPFSQKLPIIKSEEFRWIGPMVREATNLIKNYDVDIVLHSAPEFMPLLGAIPITTWTDVPYIVDLRDPWSVGPSLSGGGVKGTLYDLLSNILEPKVFDRATAIVTNNEKMMSSYLNKYPELEDKFHSINNGFDPEDYESINPAQSKKFRIVFPGKFRDDMNWLLTTLSDTIEDGAVIELSHYGRKDHGFAPEVISLVKEFGLEGAVEFHGYVSREHVLSVTKGADLGLAVTRPGDQTHVPTKIFDYIACDIPIMGVDDGDSAMRSILDDFQNAYCVDRTHTARLKSVLKTVYVDNPGALGDSQAANTYSRPNQSQELLDIIVSNLNNI